MDGVDEMSAKTLALDGNSRHGMSSSPSSVPSADVRDDDFVHVINENETSENNDER